MDSLAFLVLLFGAITVANGDLITDEMRLFKNITDRSNPFIRPVYNSSHPTSVKFGIALISIIGVDEKQGSLTTQVWLRMLWKDEHISWNPKDFGGITTMRFPIDKIWRPDLTLYNSVESDVHFGDTLSVIYSSGDVLYIPPVILRSTCKVDMTYFPFDKQECELKFGSWVYDGNNVHLDFYEGKEAMDLSDYVNSNEWEVHEVPASYNVKYYPCCTEPYPDMTFTLVIARRHSVFSLVYIAPIVFLAILCPIIFLLPYSETQRFSLGGSFLICLMIMLSSLEFVFPIAHGTMPVLAQYYISVVILLVLSLIFSAIITNVADRSTRPFPLPNILKTIFISGLGRVLCVSSDTYNTLSSHGLPEEGSIDQSKSAIIAADWRSLALVLDRFFFITYVILTVVLSLVLLVNV